METYNEKLKKLEQEEKKLIQRTKDLDVEIDRAKMMKYLEDNLDTLYIGLQGNYDSIETIKLFEKKPTFCVSESLLNLLKWFSK